MHGSPLPDHHGVLPLRHSSSVWRRTFKTRHGKLLPGGAREGMAAPAPAARRHGLRTACGSERSHRAGVMLADVAGSASSKGTTGRAGSTSPRGRRACVREESGEDPAPPSAPITTTQSRSNARASEDLEKGNRPEQSLMNNKLAAYPKKFIFLQTGRTHNLMCLDT